MLTSLQVGGRRKLFGHVNNTPWHDYGLYGLWGLKMSERDERDEMSDSVEQVRLVDQVCRYCLVAFNQSWLIDCLESSQFSTNQLFLFFFILFYPFPIELPFLHLPTYIATDNNTPIPGLIIVISDEWCPRPISLNPDPTKKLSIQGHWRRWIQRPDQDVDFIGALKERTTTNYQSRVPAKL